MREVKNILLYQMPKEFTHSHLNKHSFLTFIVKLNRVILNTSYLVLNISIRREAIHFQFLY